MGVGIGAGLGPVFVRGELRSRDLPGMFAIFFWGMVAAAVLGVVALVVGWPFLLGYHAMLGFGSSEAAAYVVGGVLEVCYLAVAGHIAWCRLRGSQGSRRATRLDELDEALAALEEECATFEALEKTYRATPGGTTAQVPGLRPGERFLGLVTGVTLLEPRGQETAGADEGRLVVSDRAMRFLGERGHREWKFVDVYQHRAGRESLMMSSLRRSTTSGIGGSPHAVSHAYALFLWGGEVAGQPFGSVEGFLFAESERVERRLRTLREQGEQLRQTAPAPPG